ncbi:glycosyltransferase family 2 protein [Cognatishimia sp. MH4019]|uniref:glycosyltransferase family 2 protein n=1 Tax=Cognatishimia sp. MH4019 TaxID=2854030 RepID=UPI001CD60FDF|nr:glycosyltransferase family 2 protein [Cognatishimia sp. MH4019]
MTVLILTSVRNEAPHLLEWIAHHRAMGAEFLVFSNDCEDGTDTLLDALQAAGIVRHVRTPDGDKPPQWRALKAAEGLVDADWVLHLDCDEFINLRAPLGSFADLIEALPADTDAVALRWRLFGHSDRIVTSDGLTMERFTEAAPEDCALPLSWFFKSLYRAAGFQKAGVHRPKQKKGSAPAWVNGSGEGLPADFARDDGRINLYGTEHGSAFVQLNHYSIRSAQEFMVKRYRGLPNRTGREIGLAYWAERNFNTVHDESILWRLEQTQAALTDLRAIAGVAGIESKGRDWHEARFAAAMTDPAEVQLYWHLQLAGTSTPPSPNAVRAHLKRRQDNQS